MKMLETIVNDDTIGSHPFSRPTSEMVVPYSIREDELEPRPFNSLAPESGISYSVEIEDAHYRIKYTNKNRGPIYFDPPDEIAKTITFHGLDPMRKGDDVMIRALAMHAEMYYTHGEVLTEEQWLLETYGIVKKPRSQRKMKPYAVQKELAA